MLDSRGDNWLKKVPTLIEEENGWRLEGFEPLSSASNYPDVCDKIAFLYGLTHKDDGVMKIGRSSRPEKRLLELRKTWKAPDLTIVKAEQVPYAGVVYAERLLHLEFDHKKLAREWFEIEPEEFLAFLPYAVIGAKKYDEACRVWHAQRYAPEEA